MRTLVKLIEYNPTLIKNLQAFDGL